MTGAFGRLRTYSDGAVFALSSMARTGVQLAASLVTARFIGPAELGLWNTVALANQYAPFAQAGVMNGLSRELPHALGRGDEHEAERLAGTSQVFTLAGCLAAAVGGFVALLVVMGQHQKALSLSVGAVTCVVVSGFYQTYLMVTFRSARSFAALARAQFWSALAAAMSIPLIIWGRYAGYLLRISVVALITVALLHVIRPMRVRMTWDGGAFRALLKTGMPIFALSYLESTAGTADRLLVLRYGGVEAVGYYALGLMVMEAFSVLPGALAIYVYPKMTYAWGRDGDRDALWSQSWKSSAVVVGLMTPFAVLGWVLLPLLVPVLFPRYAAGTRAAQLLLLAAVLAGARVGVNALWSMKAWRHMALFSLAGASLKVLGPFVGISLHPTPLAGVAWGVVAANAGAAALGLVLSYSATHGNDRNARDVEA